MNSLKLIFLLLLVGFSTSLAQTYASEKENEIYNNVVTYYNDVKSPVPIFIYYKTDIATLKRNPARELYKFRWVGQQGDIPGFREFLEQINLDTAKIKQLKHGFDGLSITKNSASRPLWEMSPIFYSSDQKLAFCTLTDEGGPENGAETAFLLQRKEEKWVVIRHIMLSIR